MPQVEATGLARPDLKRDLAEEMGRVECEDLADEGRSGELADGNAGEDSLPEPMRHAAEA